MEMAQVIPKGKEDKLLHRSGGVWGATDCLISDLNNEAAISRDPLPLTQSLFYTNRRNPSDIASYL